MQGSSYQKTNHFNIFNSLAWCILFPGNTIHLGIQLNYWRKELQIWREGPKVLLGIGIRWYKNMDVCIDRQYIDRQIDRDREIDNLELCKCWLNSCYAVLCVA